MIQFAEPIWLIAGAVVTIALLLLFRFAAQERRQSLESFAAPHLITQLTSSVSPHRRWLKQLFWILGILCLFTALARPQWGFHWQEIRRKGIDILIAIDTSQSMLAEDIRPNRLERAKLAVTDLVDQLEGDRLGLIAFAGEAFLQCPLTLDHRAFLRSLRSLDTAIIPVGGTHIASAIQEARQAFASEPQHRKILILLTDGEDLDGRALRAAQTAASEEMTIYTVGIGSSEGEIIPLKQKDGSIDFVRDEHNEIVKTKLDEEMLQEIARITGGTYEPLGKRGEGLETIYNRDLKTLPQRDLASLQQKIYYDRYQWPLAAALFFLFIELLLGERRSTRKKIFESKDIRPIHQLDVSHLKKTSSTSFHSQASSSSTPQAFSKSQNSWLKKLANRLLLTLGKTPRSLPFLALLFLAMSSMTSPLYGSAQQAEKNFQEGEYGKALQQYESLLKKNPENPALRFNFAAAAYKQGDYTQAAQAFQKSLSAEELQLQQQAYFHLGNTLYRQGEISEQENPQQTIQQWEEALNIYEGAMELDPQDQNAKFNYEFVKRRLEKLKQQQKEQQQNQQQQQPPQKNKKQEPQDSNQPSSSQNQSPEEKKESTPSQPQPKDSSSKPNQPNSSPEKPQGGKEKKQPPPQTPEGNPQPHSEKSSRNSQKPQQPKQQPGTSQPGEMTRSQAKELLEAAESNESSSPIYRQPSEHRPQSNQPPRKNW